MVLEPGAVLGGRYRIDRLLGHGGIASVYVARDLHQDRTCAVKVYHVDPHWDAATLAETQARYRTEAEVLSEIDHEGVPQLFDHFVEQGCPCIVMEHVEGDNLFQRLKHHGKPLPEVEVADWACQVLDVLEVLHQHRPRPIIHRDIKPSNIVITPLGKARLVDFGIVLRLDGVEGEAVQPGFGLATVQFAPPEQIRRDGGTDARSDLFALGATLYQALTDALPVDAVRRAANPAAWVSPRSDNPALTTDMEAIVVRAMALRPEERFQTAAEMRSALRACMAAPQVPLPAVPMTPFVQADAVRMGIEREATAAGHANGAGSRASLDAPPDTRPVRAEPVSSPRPWDEAAMLPRPWGPSDIADLDQGAGRQSEPRQPTSKRAMTRLPAARRPVVVLPDEPDHRRAARHPSTALIAGLFGLGIVSSVIAWQLRARAATVSPEVPASRSYAAQTTESATLPRRDGPVLPDSSRQDLVGEEWQPDSGLASPAILLPSSLPSPAAATTAGIAGPEACPMPLIGHIAYASDRTGNFDVYVMLADGGDQRQVTTDPGDDRYPALSPNGRRIAFAATRDRAASDIYVVNTDGSGERRLTDHAAEDRLSAWSPDNARLAFDSVREGVRGIFWIDAGAGETDTARAVRLSPAGSYAGHPSWSVRRQLAFNTDPDADADVFAMAEGDVPHRLTTSADADWAPAWSPDGAHVVFATAGAGGADIAVVDNAGGLARVLLRTEGYDWAPSWSPDGAYIAFTSDITGRNQIYSMRTDGSCVRQLTYDGTSEYPSWSW